MSFLAMRQMAAVGEDFQLRGAYDAAGNPPRKLERPILIPVAVNHENGAGDVSEFLIEAPGREAARQPDLAPCVEHPPRPLAVPADEFFELLGLGELRRGGPNAGQG